MRVSDLVPKIVLNKGDTFSIVYTVVITDKPLFKVELVFDDVNFDLEDVVESVAGFIEMVKDDLKADLLLKGVPIKDVKVVAYV